MREIKFRLWDPNENEFVEQKQIAVKGNGEVMADTGKEWVEDIDNNDYILMQYTGLRDRNGKEIYEGDILRNIPENKWEEINYCCFEIFFHDGDANTDYNIGYSMSRTHFKGSVCGVSFIPSFKPKNTNKMIIIGNIYENKTL